MSFEDRVILITGASSGIGAATAIHFSKLGALLAITGRNATNLNETAAKCAAAKRPPLQIVGDVMHEQDCVKIVDTTIKHFGKLDVLVNSAGILEPGSIETATLKSYDRTMNANVRSIFHLTQLATPHLIAAKGNVVNVSSVTGIRSFPGVLAYNMSKSAVDQMTRCVALELAAKGVRVNSVNPGVIVTEVHKRGGMDDKTYEEFLKRSALTHALGRVGTADEVAHAIGFLASDAASFITGVQLPVDGGRHAMCPR